MSDKALHYGCWSAALAFVTLAITNGYGMLSHGARLSAFLPSLLVMQVVPATVTFAVAVPGWALLHRIKRRPGWIGYTFLALGVVVATQSLLSVPLALLAPKILDPLIFVK